MKIGIDIDGVIADFVEEFLPRLNKYCKCDFKDIVSFNFEKNVNISKVKYKKLWKKAEKDGIYSILKLIKGSSDAVNKLSMENEVILITSRGKKFRDDTLKWLKRNGIKFKRLFVVDNKRKKVMKMSKCDIALEDDLEVARMVEARGIPVLLFDYPWNKIGRKIKRIKNWNQALKQIGKVKNKCNEKKAR